MADFALRRPLRLFQFPASSGVALIFFMALSGCGGSAVSQSDDPLKADESENEGSGSGGAESVSTRMPSGGGGMESEEPSDLPQPECLVELPQRVDADVNVKVTSGLDLSCPYELIPEPQRAQVEAIGRFSSLTPEELQRLGGGVFLRWFSVKLRPDVDAEVFASELIAHADIEVAEVPPEAGPPPELP